MYKIVEVKDSEYIFIKDIDVYEGFLEFIKNSIPKSDEFLNIIHDCNLHDFKELHVDPGLYLLVNTNKIHFVHKIKSVTPKYFYNTYTHEYVIKNKWILVKLPISELNEEIISVITPSVTKILLVNKTPNQLRYLYPPNNTYDKIFIITDKIEKFDIYSKLYPITRTMVRYGYIPYNLTLLNQIRKSLVIFDLTNLDMITSTDEFLEVLYNTVKNGNTCVFNVLLPLQYIDKTLRSNFDKIIE